MNSSGKIWGIGVGPGDPDLITLKAHRILKGADVIAYPAPAGGDSLVRSIAAPHIPEGKEEFVISTPMEVARHPAQDVYDWAADEIGKMAESGKSVAILCEGDPFFFGSFMYLFSRLCGAHDIQVVPGVNSVAACAAACAFIPRGIIGAGAVGGVSGVSGGVDGDVETKDGNH